MLIDKSEHILHETEWNALIDDSNPALPKCCENVVLLRGSIWLLFNGGFEVDFDRRTYLHRYYRVLQDHWIPGRYKVPLEMLASECRRRINQ